MKIKTYRDFSKFSRIVKSKSAISAQVLTVFFLRHFLSEREKMGTSAVFVAFTILCIVAASCPAQIFGMTHVCQFEMRRYCSIACPLSDAYLYAILVTDLMKNK